MFGHRYNVLILALVSATILFEIAVADGSNVTTAPSERYELCQNQMEIDTLQQTYGLILVSSTPTKAAMYPSWPEALINIAFVLLTLGQWAMSGEGDAGFGFFNLIVPFVVNIFWTVSFGFLQNEKQTGGWISVTDGALSTILLFWAFEDEAVLIAVIVLLFSLFQAGGEWAVIIQRWKQEIGSIAYVIDNNNGCIPYNGFGYLQEGVRSQAFKIIQTVEFFYSGIGITFVFGAAASGNLGARQIGIQGVTGIFLLLIFVPVLIYQIIIAVKGTPVVISGNCMLVELNPKWGFLDSEIENWWKALVSIAGM